MHLQHPCNVSKSEIKVTGVTCFYTECTLNLGFGVCFPSLWHNNDVSTSGVSPATTTMRVSDARDPSRTPQLTESRMRTKRLQSFNSRDTTNYDTDGNARENGSPEIDTWSKQSSPPAKRRQTGRSPEILWNHEVRCIENWATREEATNRVREVISNCVSRDLPSKALIAWDFSLAFPAGLAAALGLEKGGRGQEAIRAPGSRNRCGEGGQRCVKAGWRVARGERR